MPTKCQTDLAACKTTLTARNAEIGTLKARVAALEAELTTCKAGRVTDAAKIAALEAEIKRLTEQPPPPPPPPPPVNRPYADTSVFNTKVPVGAVATPNSAAVIARLAGPTGPSYFVAQEPTRDYGVAVYTPAPTDPEYVIEAREYGNWCEIDGDRIRLPRGAHPSGVWPLRDPNADHDSHLTVIQDGVEYDLWNIRSITPGTPGKIVTRWGGKTDIDGDGLGSGAVAAEFGSLAGLIRPDEFIAGEIPHALTVTVPCTNGYHWPATKGGWECDNDTNALVMGDLLQLRMTDEEIATFPTWKRGILKAWKEYGCYVRDTTSSQDWAIWFESGKSFTSLGKPDPFAEFAKSLGMQAYDYDGDNIGGYWFDIGGGVDWASKLRVVQQ